MIPHAILGFNKILIIIWLSSLYSEEKSSIEIQRDINSRNVELQSLRNEIKNIEETLIRKNKEAISNTEILIELENKISLSEKLIRALHREEQYISKLIQNTNRKIEEMEYRLLKLKSQITQRLQHLYIYGRPGILETILLADNWNSAIYRIKYLDVLAEHEKKLRKELILVLDQLEKEKDKKRIELNHKKVLLNEKKTESEKLAVDKNKRKKVLKDIKKEKLILEENRTYKRQMVTKIENLINQLYADKVSVKKREQELARIRAEQNLATTGNFSKMIGKLSWPVEGPIISKFGTIRNPTTGTITENVGIDIQSSSGAKVKSVLDGVVSTITYIRGHGNIIIIDHGGGFSTVYAHLENITVNENEYVQIGKFIADVAESDNGSPHTLHFEVWGNQKKLNPQKWLVSR